jgi:hypothetical protein
MIRILTVSAIVAIATPALAFKPLPIYCTASAGPGLLAAAYHSDSAVVRATRRLVASGACTRDATAPGFAYVVSVDVD